VRTPSSLLAVAALIPIAAVALAGCTTDPTAIDGCIPVAGPGGASSLVTVEGEVGSEATISFPTPLYSDGLQRSVLVPGEGARIKPGQQVHFHASIVNGVTGAPIATTDYTDQGFARAVAGQISNFGIALTCARVGERVVLTGPALDVLGADALANSGMPEDQPLVLVFDIDNVFLAKADGINQLPADGLPVVTTAVDGTPGVTLPKYAPPANLTTAAIKLGGGDVVTTGDEVVVNFTVWSWPTDGSAPTVLNSTWSSVASIFSTDAADMPAGFLAGTVGYPVGSQVMVLTPATAEEDARIFVVDILGVKN